MENPYDNLHRISVPAVHGMKFIDVYHIICCEADGNYTTFYLSEKNKKLLVTLLLQKCEVLLSPFSCFIRIHKSFLLNLNFAGHYEKGKDGSLLLNNKMRFTDSRNYKK